MDFSKLKWVLTIFLLGFSIASGAVAPGHQSWFSLLAKPEKYDGKSIRITGWLKIEFAPKGEIYSLYMSSEDMREELLDRALRLDSSSVGRLLGTYSDIREDWLKIDGKRVDISGLFVASTEENNYTEYPYQGAVIKITEIDVYGKSYSVIKEKDAKKEETR